MINEHRTFELKKIKEETHNVCSLYFNCPEIAREARAGQYAMVWVPGVDEVPMSVSKAGGNVLGITVKVFGEASRALCESKVGDFIGLRGPFGNYFDLTGAKNVIMIGGGVGLPPLMPIVDKVKDKNLTIILAARTKEDIFFKKRCEVNGVKTLVSTDDGTMGFKWYAHELLDRELTRDSYDLVLACGPEIMLKYIHEVCLKHKMRHQLSLERYMKCGTGVCGQCVMDPVGLILCKEGPVVDGEKLRRLTEFGEYKRGKSGAKEDV
jgi:dihydroorotate dehydrogenase electron transfer subunit